MPAKIISGFPLRRCSWFFNPIAPDALSRKMIRWLDLVCLKAGDRQGVNFFMPRITVDPRRREWQTRSKGGLSS